MKKAEKLIKTIKDALTKDQYLNDLYFFILTSDGYYRVSDGIIAQQLVRNGMFKIRMPDLNGFQSYTNSHIDRGEILEAFSKIEYLVNELIKLKLNIIYNKQSNLINEIFENINFASRISLLHQFNIITKQTKTNLLLLVKVRNELAHKFLTMEVNYKNERLFNCLAKFIQEFNDTSQVLIDIYDQEFEKLDIELIIKEIESRGKTI